MLNRRQFLGVIGAAASWPAAGLRDSPIGEWGSPVFDLHFRMRRHYRRTARRYPNLYGDLSANSDNNVLSRDPALTADFLRRRQHKLLFGSDCGCTDGHGGGVSQGNNPAAARLAGKCVARETLTVLKRSTSADFVKRVTWENALTLLKVPA